MRSVTIIIPIILREPTPRRPPSGRLRYVPETKTFVASAVPDGAFPMQVMVSIGSSRVTVVISERSGQ